MKNLSNVAVGRIEKGNDRIVTVCKTSRRIREIDIIPPSDTSYNCRTAETS